VGTVVQKVLSHLKRERYIKQPPNNSLPADSNSKSRRLSSGVDDQEMNYVAD